MVDIPLVWASGARKEAMDLLLTLWTSGVPEVRDQLAEAIIAGPPHDLLAHIEIDEREKSRDRRIFDRLIVLERLGDPPLNVMLMAESARIRGIYPNWRAPAGEAAPLGA